MIGAERAARLGAGKEAGYRYYRLFATARAGGTGAVRVGDLYLYSPTFPTGVPSGGTPIASVREEWAERAFDDDATSIWSSFGSSLPEWVGYRFGRPLELTGYAVRAPSSNAGNTASAWFFQASRDGLTWETIDSQSGFTWSDRQRREFPL